MAVCYRAYTGDHSVFHNITILRHETEHKLPKSVNGGKICVEGPQRKSSLNRVSRDIEMP